LSGYGDDGLRLASQFIREAFYKSPQRSQFNLLGWQIQHRYDATHSTRVAQRNQIDQGGYETFGLPISFRILAMRYKAQT